MRKRKVIHVPSAAVRPVPIVPRPGVLALMPVPENHLRTLRRFHGVGR